MQGPATPTIKVTVPLHDAHSHVTALAHSVDLDGCIVASSDGGLYLLDCATSSLQEVGQLDAPIIAMGWSPDGDVLMLATAAGVPCKLACRRDSSCHGSRLCSEIAQMYKVVAAGLNALGTVSGTCMQASC
jgi:IKI3 family